MPAEQTAKLSPSRVPLPNAKEMPLLDAVYWIAFGVFPHPTTLSSNERAVFDARERTFEEWCRSQPGDLSYRAYVVSQPPRRKVAVAVEDVKHLWPIRRPLDDAGLRFLRLSINAARLHRSFAARFDLAQSELLEAAKSGSVTIRAKIDASAAIPEPLDPAYFRNPVELELPSGDIGRARRSHIQQAGSRTITANLKRYDPLVSVKDMASVFARPVSQISDVPILNAARKYMHALQGGRVIKADVKTHLKEAGFEVGKHRWHRISKRLSDEFPESFQVGRPRKK